MPAQSLQPAKSSAFGKVHLWLFDPPVLAGDACHDVLTEAEQLRSLRYIDPRLGVRWRAHRALVRVVLSRYTGLVPQEVPIVQGPHGKPELGPQGDGPRVVFSLSHSKNRLAIAVARQGELGVDLEVARLDRVTDGLIDICCHPSEQVLLAKLPMDERCRAFHQVWTCKEALAKAVGVGLSRDLTEWLVTIGGGPVEVLETPADLAQPIGGPAPAPRAAVAAERCDAPVPWRLWTNAEEWPWLWAVAYRGSTTSDEDLCVRVVGDEPPGNLDLPGWAT